MNSNNNLEPRRDLPLHKIPELLAKITGTFSSPFDVKSIDRCEEFFDIYSNRTSTITVDGLLRFCSDLSLAPDSFEFLLFCFLCRAKRMYFLTRDEFVRGWNSLGDQIENLNEIRRHLIDFDVRKVQQNEFYRWTFQFGLNEGQRNLTTRNAIDLWKLFYSKSKDKPMIFDRWIDYLEEDMINDIPKLITCDTWTIFPQFGEFIRLKGFHSYDENDGWPCLFDSFVENQLKR